MSEAKVSFPLVVNRAADATRFVQQARECGKRVGLVPTMGALHAGHLSLVRAARDACDITAVTIFVNPTQFGPGEDLDRYPRTLERDLQLLSTVGADLVFVPVASEIYPPGFSTFVEPPAVAEHFEGALRPGHFRGVATVVLKLFHILPAQIAFFGQKDFQQTRVIGDMVRDLAVPIELRICPTVREADGLAMSSRNQYLPPDLRLRAPAMYRSLELGRALIQGGETNVEKVTSRMRRELLDAGFAPIDYIAIADPHTLEEMSSLAHRPLVLLVAARLGSTRLIDNCVISEKP